MQQKVITLFCGTDSNPQDHQPQIEKYFKEGWQIVHSSTAYFDRAGHGTRLAITLLLQKQNAL